MDFRQLRALMAVADHGTFSAAADALDTVQSNISTHIARLEKELGSQLIDRQLNRLTPEGEAVVRRSRRIASEMDNIGADVAAFRNEVMGEVSFGMIQTTAQWLLPYLLDDLEHQFPDTYLRVTEGTTTTIEPLLQQGILDLAIIQVPSRNPEVSAEEILEEEIVLIAPADHALAGREDLQVADLAKISMLLPTIGTAPRTEIDSIARRAGVSLTAKAEVDSTELTLALVLRGHGPALAPISAIPETAQERWAVIHLSDLPTRRVAIAQHRRTPLSPPVRAVRQLIIDIVRRQAANKRGFRLVDGTQKSEKNR